MDRRDLIKTGSVASTAGVIASLAMLSPSAANASTAPAEDALSFVTPDMDAHDVSNLIAETGQEKRDYVAHVNSLYADYSAREQLRMVLLRDSGAIVGSSVHQGAPPMVGALPLVAIAGRALLAAVRRYGPRMYNSLKNAVKSGYDSFNEWTKNNPFVAGIIGGVSSAALYDWLTTNI